MRDFLIVCLSWIIGRRGSDTERRRRGELSWDDPLASFLPEDVSVPHQGSFLSTANDMLRYLHAYWESTGGPDDALRRALQEVVRKRRPTDVSQRAIGLAWHIDSENALDINWHNGGAGGSRSDVAFLRELPVGVGVLSNSSDPVDFLGYRILYLLARS